jgi:ATP-binding cassette subfamily C (CFTR/MRP) protein 1
MDNGEIAEFDEPLTLYDQQGVFRGMCDQSAITREEIVRARVVN